MIAAILILSPASDTLKMGHSGLGKATYLIGPALGSGAIKDQRKYCENRMRAYPYDSIEVERTSPITIEISQGDLIASDSIFERR